MLNTFLTSDHTARTKTTYINAERGGFEMCEVDVVEKQKAALGKRVFLHMRKVMISSVEPATHNNHGAGLLRFTQFFDSLGISEDSRMPALDSLLANFASSAAAQVSGKSAAHWLMGLHMWHTLQGAEWLGSVAKLTPPSSHRPQRPPITIVHIEALFKGLDLTNSCDLANWAVASIAFWGCCCLGELIVQSEGDFDPCRNITQGGAVSFASFHLPFTKTTLHALRHHLKTNLQVPADAPLFAFQTVDGWSPMTKPWFMAICNQVWGNAKLDTVKGGHSFRIGGATELLLRGTPPDVVTLQGHWLSDVFLLYWQKIESILPMFISHSFYSSLSASVRTAIDSFASRYHSSR
ncbi:DNA breaking-rejoining enzyme [Artomyces pyxidatus]|uniref:DNA breaking-rejoining enzyme n=1 Tax=Artomyces pyxidatus TaxID=48021 RepID=A0ACB8TGM7_9AGAM|nr:DNA breaking-rejoining enzyme [Artomyces pyxidatus]